MRRGITTIAALVALAGMTALMGWACVGLIAQTRAPGPASFDTEIGLVAAVSASGCGAWLAVGAALTVLGSLPGALAAAADSLARRIAPAAWRRVIHLAIGTALVSGPVGVPPAWADNHSTAYVSTASAANPPGGLDSPSPDPATLPPIDRPGETAGETTWTPSAPPPPVPIAPPASPLVTGNARPAAVVEEHVVVRRGDTLWHIAGRHLGPSASAAEIALEWPRWWNTNRNIIGPDPDRILPGQLLRPPA
jgi:nucleoid-associated protein YgaU